MVITSFQLTNEINLIPRQKDELFSALCMSHNCQQPVGLLGYRC